MKKEEIVKKIKELKGARLWIKQPSIPSGERYSLEWVEFSAANGEFEVEGVYLDCDFFRGKPVAKFVGRNKKTYPTIEEGLSKYVVEGKPLYSIVEHVAPLEMIYL